MKNLFVLLVFFFVTISVPAFNLAVQEDPVETIPFWTFVLEFASSSILALVLVAAKHILNKTWDWSEFWKGSLKTSIYSIIGGILLIALQYFLPQYEVFVSTNIQGEISLDHSVLLSTGLILTLIIKSYFSNKDTKK